MELVIISIIIGAAVLYLAITFYRRFKKPSCSCGSEQCPLEKKHKIT